MPGALCSRPSPLPAPPPCADGPVPSGRFFLPHGPAMSPRERAAQPRRRCPPAPPAGLPLLTRCLAAERPGHARAAATRAALLGTRRLDAGLRAQARLHRTRTILPARRHLRLLPARCRSSVALSALTQHHEDAGLPRCSRRLLGCRRHLPSCACGAAAQRRPPPPLRPPAAPSTRGGGYTGARLRHPPPGPAWSRPAGPSLRGGYLPARPAAAERPCRERR